LVLTTFMSEPTVVENDAQLDDNRAAISKIEKLLSSLDSALDYALENAKSEAGKLAVHCMKTVDLYLEHQVNSFEELYASVEHSSAFASIQLMKTCQDLYMNKLIVLDSTLLDSPLASEDFRSAFIQAYNTIFLELVNLRKHITELNKSVFEYRKEEVSKAIVVFKHMKEEVQAKREVQGKEDLEIPKDRMGTAYKRWKTTHSANFDASVDEFVKARNYFEDELKRSLDHCKEVARISNEYCKAAIDRSIEAEVPVFDELINWTKADLANALQSCEKIKRSIADQISVKAIGNVFLNGQLELTMKQIGFIQQD
ncbi:hypothetical protein PMAYCL1PPCAC_32887, partial [Pristionchus mayeri]